MEKFIKYYIDRLNEIILDYMYLLNFEDNLELNKYWT